MPEGEEKNLWLEIKKIADKTYPTVIIEDLTDDCINKQSN